MPGGQIDSARSWLAFRGLSPRLVPAVVAGDHALANSAGVLTGMRRRAHARAVDEDQLGIGPVAAGR
eukprot:740698-Pyramimonas_sp.AAC.1